MKRQAVDRYEGPTTALIDVSRWQGRINWAEVAASKDPEIRGVICRTGDGGGRDRAFVANIRGARDVGLLVGSYHYFRADRGALAQAALVEEAWAAAGGFQAGKDLPPVLDLEEGARADLPGGIFSGGQLPIALVADQALEFQQAIDHAFGVRPGVYGGQALHWWLAQTHPELASDFAPFWLWLASYSRLPMMPVDRRGRAYPWLKWSLWQHSPEGRVPGIAGDVDLNYFRGDESELAAFCDASQIC